MDKTYDLNTASHSAKRSVFGPNKAAYDLPFLGQKKAR